MPVANNQTEEIYNILRKYLTQKELREILIELRQTEAYRRNKSFAVTIDRLRAISHPRDK